MSALDKLVTYSAIGLPLLTLLANFAIVSRLREKNEHQASSRSLQRVSVAFLVVAGLLYLGISAIPELVLMMGAVFPIAVIAQFAVLAVQFQLLLKGIEKGRTIFAIGLSTLTIGIWIFWLQQ